MLTQITIGAVAVGAATFAGLHTMWPTSQLYGSSFTGEPRPSKRLALTYDDGPNEPHTERLLEMLANHNVRATFFMLGRHVEQRPAIAHQVHQAGHTIGNHSYSHPNLIFASDAELRSQIERTQKAIADATGEAPKFFRPPFGGRNLATFRVARELGLTPIMWRVTCYDWKAKSAASIVAHAQRQIRGGEVILLHDGGHLGLGTDRSLTVEATDELIRRYKGEGYEFVTVPEMQSSVVSRRS